MVYPASKPLYYRRRFPFHSRLSLPSQAQVLEIFKEERGLDGLLSRYALKLSLLREAIRLCFSDSGVQSAADLAHYG